MSTEAFSPLSLSTHLYHRLRLGIEVHRGGWDEAGANVTLCSTGKRVPWAEVSCLIQLVLKHIDLKTNILKIKSMPRLSSIRYLFWGGGEV